MSRKQQPANERRESKAEASSNESAHVEDLRKAHAIHTLAQRMLQQLSTESMARGTHMADSGFAGAWQTPVATAWPVWNTPVAISPTWGAHPTADVAGNGPVGPTFYYWYP